MNREFKIGDVMVGLNHEPFVIAEMSGNHNQSIERAKSIIDAAASAGAHAVKLQTYTAETMTIKGAVHVDEDNKLWGGRELYDLYEEAHTPWDWHAALFEHAKKRGIIIFSSPFDETAVDFLHQLDAPAYKIASFENTDHPLLKKVAATGKPVIMSTGVASISEIFESVSVLKSHGCTELVLLKCTSTYPASPIDSNINTIPLLRQIFPDCVIGLSDHTMGIGAAVGAVALGARVIEKHFTLDRADGGVDSSFSMEPQEMASLVRESKTAFEALGKAQLEVSANEKKNRLYKRSIFVSQPVKKGDLFTEQNLKVIRPGIGLEPKFKEMVMGKSAKQDIPIGTPLSWDLLF
jgi:pseudaminic acid synthase